MDDTDIWLIEFAKHHDDLHNRGVYWTSWLLLLNGVVGLLWSMPVPDEFLHISPLLNWGSAFLMVTMVYYFIISLSLGLGMVAFVFVLYLLQLWLMGQTADLGCIACIQVGTGVAGLSFSRYDNGGTRAVLRDIQLIMIAPIWVLSTVYRRLGIPS